MTQSKLKRIAVIPDVHYPYHDKAAWRLLRRCLAEYPPDVLVVLGDFLDLYCMSDYTKSPKRVPLLVQELRGAAALLDDLSTFAKERVFCVGNHEERLHKRIREKLPALEGAANIETLLKLKPKWKVVQYGSALQIGKFWFSHDFGYAGANATRESLAGVGDNCVFGHSHRAGVVYSGTALGVRHVGLNCGWLGDKKATDYGHSVQKTRDWQTGFGLIHMEKSGVGHAQFIPFIRGRAVINGQLIE